ncbi:MAG: enolase C-terminal domain-like protein, partial [Gammaproteobacteria bacterium]
MHEPTFDADRLGDIDIARVETARYRLPLTGPWHSAHGARQQREGWLLRLTSRTGATGLGECAPLPEAGTESLAVAAATWRTLLPRLVGRRADTVLATLQRLAATPAVRCALEAAVLDLAAATAGRPLAHCLNPATATVVRVNAALGGLDAGVPKRAVRAVAEGYRVLKLKLGLSPLGTEIAALRELSSRLPDRVVLRLDANRAWDDATAVQAVEALAGLPVEALEEPLRVPHPTALRQLQDRAPWPLALDESLSRWDLEPLLKDPPVRRIVLKPMVTGGPL